MVLRVRKTISDHRKRLLPGLVALSLLAGIIVSVVSLPNAQADLTNGCGYGYGSDSLSYGYGTGYGYGYGGSGFAFGYGYQIGTGGQACPTTTTTTTTTTVPPTTTTTSPGGGTTTTSTTSTTTTTVPATTTTIAACPKPVFKRISGRPAYIGRTALFVIHGLHLKGVRASSNGAWVKIVKDTATLLKVDVTPKVGKKSGVYLLKATDKCGTATIRYSQFYKFRRNSSGLRAGGGVHEGNALAHS